MARSNRSALNLALLLSVTVLPPAASQSYAATQRERAEKADALVAEALRLETYAQNQQREQLLDEALKQDPDHDAARWHSGHVKIDGRWHEAAAVPDATAEDRRLQQYEKRRDETPATAQAQLELAHWCANRGLTDQARAHVTKVLELDSDHAEARRLLGFRFVEGAWISADEIAEANESAKSYAANLAKWRPKLQRIGKGLAHRSLARREAAMEQLLEIDDPAAIGAMEQLAASGEEAAQAVVKALGTIQAFEAAHALARIGVLAPWQAVREASSEQLQRRALDQYVPELLAAMVTPIKSQAELYRAPRGRLLYRHSFFREGQREQAVAVSDTTYQRRGAAGGSRRDTLNRALVAIGLTAQEREQQVQLQNMATAAVNERVSELLRATTGETIHADPTEWWAWWDRHNEVYNHGYKPLRRQYEQELVKVYDRTGGGSPPLDCLAAGTKIWTAAGPVSVERVEVGDLVLSQDPATGELAYKPVLRTTVRPIGQLIDVRIGDETITTSGGHLFWVSGRGWQRARHLADAMPVHAIDGAVRITAPPSTDGPTARSYNLVVADFHTYFVGDTKVLSHDNTIRETTNKIVPGLEK